MTTSIKFKRYPLYFANKHTKIVDDIIFFKIFCTNSQVTCIGHIIGLILADTKDHANKAANAVQVEYEDLPVILTIEVSTSH